MNGRTFSQVLASEEKATTIEKKARGGVEGPDIKKEGTGRGVRQSAVQYRKDLRMRHAAVQYKGTGKTDKVLSSAVRKNGEDGRGTQQSSGSGRSRDEDRRV